MQKAINFNHVAIVSIKGNDHTTHFWYMSKGDAIKITKNSDLNKTVDYSNFFTLYKNE